MNEIERLTREKNSAAMLADFCDRPALEALNVLRYALAEVRIAVADACPTPPSATARMISARDAAIRAVNALNLEIEQ